MKSTIITLLISTIVLSSCKKNKPENPVPPVQHKVKTITFQSGDVSNFEYDSQGRLIKITGSTSREEYTYTNTTATWKLYQGAVLLDQINYTLNAQGMATRLTKQNGETEDYTYNSNLQRLTEIHSDGYKYYYYYTGNNADSIIILDGNSTVRKRWYFEYDPATNNTIGQSYEGISFIGRDNEKAYRVRRIKHFDANGVLQNTQVNDFAYEKDAQGRITREIMTGGTSSDHSYTYY